MATEVLAQPTAFDRLRPAIRAIGPFRLAAIIVAVLAFGYLWIRAGGRLPEATTWQVPLVLMLLIVSLPWRTVSAGLVARFFFIGFGPVFFAAALAQVVLIASPLHGALTDLSGDLALSGFGSLGDIRMSIWAPLTEEILKVAPLIVLLLLGRSHLRTQGGPLDFAILAGATGAGLGFAEDLLQVGGFAWSTPESPLLGLGAGTAYIGLVASPLNRFPLDAFDLNLTYQGIVGIFNPSVEELQNGAIWAGHGVLPLFVGLAIGLAVLWRRRFGPVVYVLPLVALFWVTWDHFVGNWYSSVRCARVDAPTLCGLTHLDFAGGLLPLVVIGGWALATIVTMRLVARHRAADPALDVRRAQVSPAAYRGSGATWPIRYGRDVLRFLRMRNRAAMGWSHLERASGPDLERRAEAVAATRLEGALIAARLRNQPVPAVPPGIRARLDRLIARG